MRVLGRGTANVERIRPRLVLQSMRACSTWLGPIHLPLPFEGIGAR